MKRLVTILSVLALLGITGTALADTQEPFYGFTISSSDSDPNVNSGASGGGIYNLYMWFQCSGNIDGLSAFECDLTPSGGLALFGVTVMNDFLNFGTVTSPQFGVGGCPTGDVVMASLLVQDTGDGALCIDPASGSGFRYATSCAPVVAYEARHRGYSTDGSVCETYPGLNLCEKIVSVEGGSWGSVKSLYR